MSVTVAQAIQAARDEHPAFDEFWNTRAPLLRFLERYQQQILGRIFPLKRDAVQSIESVSFPLADFDAGYTLPAHLYVSGGYVTFVTSTLPKQPAVKVEEHRRFSYQPAVPGWPFYVQGLTLYPLGAADDWTDVATLEVEYFPVGGTLSALTSTFVLPKEPLPCLVAGLAAFMASRVRTELKVDVGQFKREADAALRAYIDTVTERGVAKIAMGREVY